MRCCWAGQCYGAWPWAGRKACIRCTSLTSLSPHVVQDLLVSGVLQKLQMHDERSWNASWLFAVAYSAICSGGNTFADASNINSFVADVQVLETLRKELRLSMALMGCPSLAHLNRRMVLAPWEHPSARL